MKKIVVTSDSHGKRQKIYKIYKLHKDADLFVHLGDYISDADDAIKRLGVNVMCIKANGDMGSFEPLKKDIILEGKKIVAVHGHIERVKWSLTRLSLLAQQEKADIMLFGHTHIPLVEYTGTLFVNPGYAYAGQYAIVTIDKGIANAKICQL